MSKPEEKKKAIALRRKGKSIKDIARQVGVSRSSVSVWVREVKLSQAQRALLHEKKVEGGHVGRMKGAERNKQQRLDRLARYKKDSVNEIAELSLQDLFFLGLGLYWGEGFKARGGSAGFSNSDPRVIQIMIMWLEQCMHVSRNRLRVQVFINDIHRDREKTIRHYWMNVTGLPAQQFAKIIFLAKAKKFYENKNSYYGVCAVRILKGTEIKDRVNALIQQSFEIHGQCRRSSVVRADVS